MKKLLIIGGGPLGNQITHFAELSGKYKPIGYLDDFIKSGTNIDTNSVIGTVSDAKSMFEDKIYDEAFIAIGYNRFEYKEKMYDYFSSLQIPLATIIAPGVTIDPTAKIGQGCCLTYGVHIDMETIIEDNVVLNVRTIIGHNCLIKAHSYFAGNVVIAGETTIGKRCFIGMNSSINDHLSVCDDVFIGSSTTIRKDIVEPGLYVVKDKVMHINMQDFNSFKQN